MLNWEISSKDLREDVLCILTQYYKFLPKQLQSKKNSFPTIGSKIVKPSLITKCMNLYVENPKDSTKIL